MAQHKPGSLKQKNKKHKGKDGKRAQNKVMGAGKVNATVRKSAKSNAQKDLNNKSDRLNRNNQLKKIKRDQVWLQKRSGASGTAGTSATTKTIGVLALSDFADPYACVQECLRQMGVASSISSGSANVFHAFDSIDKTHFTFLLAPTALKRDQFFALELTKAADIIMFVVCNDALNEFSAVIDETGLSALSAMKAMGCPDALFCVQSSSLSSDAMDEGLSSSSINTKKKGAAAYASRKAVHQYIEEHALLPDARIVDLDLARSNNMLARTLRSMNPKPISWRSQRSYLVADVASVQVQEQPHSDASTNAESRCKVQLSGYLRGRPMNVHSLMHLVGVGAGRIVKVSRGRAPGVVASPNDDLSPVFADKDRQDSLQLEAVGNGLMGEQTWPTEEELRMVGADEDEQPHEEGDRNAGRDRRVLKAEQLIPKGMSSYQADWFMDEEGQLDFNGKATAGAGGAGAAAGGGGDEEEEGDGSSIGDEEFTVGGGTISGKKSVAGSKFNSKGIPYTLKERQELDEAFPDEMDTPDDVSARVRFARYRALLSFRASPWHPKENLPQDYARIFQFEHFAGTQRRLLAESKAVEQMQMHHALQVRSAHKSGASGTGSVCGSVLSQGDRMDEEDEEEESENEEEGEGEDNQKNGMELENGEAPVTMTVSASNGAGRARRPSFAGSVGFNEAAATGKITVPEADDFIQTGQYITIKLEDVPALVAQRLQEYGFLLCYALFAHEHKLSVLHFSVQRHAGYTEPIKSKDEMLFVTGFRSFLARPVYSESNLNCDKHKFERFLLADRFSMASCFGPVLVSNCPLLVYKRTDPHADSSNNSNGSSSSSRGCGEGWTLVATGTLANVEPDRIMLKKIVLTGFPIRVRKKFAVVRHLFHDPQDVRWFKPAELVTKWGLRGHITEPVGTHGLLKAMFSGAIKQNDTVMLILYKRVYPKFPSFGLQIQ